MDSWVLLKFQKNGIKNKITLIFSTLLKLIKFLFKTIEISKMYFRPLLKKINVMNKI